MYKNILLAIDLNDETSCRKPLLSAVELAHTFGARLHVLTVVREVEVILEARAATIAYEVIVSDLQNRMPP
jgi:nucleotide-binding universal stress UspA family protein